MTDGQPYGVFTHDLLLEWRDMNEEPALGIPGFYLKHTNKSYFTLNTSF